MTEKHLQGELIKPAAKFFGKYRGTVLNNIDPLALGRLIADVPAASRTLNWGMPCALFTTSAPAAVPPIGAHVWIEFEQGDPNFPIWTGCFWAVGEPPLLALP